MVRKLAVLMALFSLYALGQLFPPSYSAPKGGGGSVTYPITAPQGGSGIVSPSANCVLTGEGSSPFGVQCPQTAGYVLTDNGTGSDPTMQPAQLFIDVNTFPFVISPTAGNTTAYLDCSLGTFGGNCSTGISIHDGNEDGQLLSIVCSSQYASDISFWTLTGDFRNFSNLILGGANAGSYDQGNFAVDVTETSCGAQLMWSNANGVWELLNLYGGVTS